jgi:hypothetical protein
LHPRAPYARLDAWGAAFLVAARPGNRAIAVDPDAVHVETTGARLRIFRTPPSADAVFAWSLCHARSAAAAAKVG